MHVLKIYDLVWKLKIKYSEFLFTEEEKWEASAIKLGLPVDLFTLSFASASWNMFKPPAHGFDCWDREYVNGVL